jgi:hypothetical protein
MRKELKNLSGQRMRFCATVERLGHKNGYKGPVPTILLKDVRRVDTGEVVTDHLWFTVGKTLSVLSPGDEVEFDARVASYEKGYKGYREDVYCPVSKDYKLERPTKLTRRVDVSVV